MARSSLRSSIVRWLKESDSAFSAALRSLVVSFRSIWLPIPMIVVRPVVISAVALVLVYRWLKRVMLCEPYFKARCAEFGANVKTGSFFHYVQGVGRIVVGSSVTLQGKSSIIFGAVFSEPPELLIGDGSYINHNTMFVVARRVQIGRRVLIAPNVTIADSPGHSTDPKRRWAGMPPSEEEILPIEIQDNVWICAGATILPGVSIGRDSVVGCGAVVTRSVPAGVLVVGSPATIVRRLNDREGR